MSITRLLKKIKEQETNRTPNRLLLLFNRDRFRLKVLLLKQEKLIQEISQKWI